MTAPAKPSVKALFLEGLTDAAGFVVGGMAGYGLSRLLGLDTAAPSFGVTMAEILLVGTGAGAGVQIARKLRARANRKTD